MKNRLLLFFLLTVLCSASCSDKPLYLRTRPSFERRADDLLSRMTLEEKVSFLKYDSPAIERLGIPQYNHWNECLHGVARAGKATVFPQAIGMAAMWDKEMMYDIAVAVSDEARAKYGDFSSRGERGNYQGLTFFTPNINLFRDPRWGRGMETYGEDPFLTGELAASFIGGLQGTADRDGKPLHPKYLKTIATAKHFAVHSGPEFNRHSFDVRPDEYDFVHSYTPQFRRVVDAGVYSIMCAYNRLDGDPCCGNKMLSDLLREQWGFKGYIVSDCWAIADFYNEDAHNMPLSPTEAAVKALRAGTDLNCGGNFRRLTDAVKEGLMKEEELNPSVKRIIMARMRLGQFDPDSKVPYTQIPYSVVESPAHTELSAEAARRSMVLLKNDGLLPLSKEIKKIAVIGPNADSQEMMLGNYNGTPSQVTTALEGVRNKLPQAEVSYAQGCPLVAGLPGASGDEREKKKEAIAAASAADIVIMCMGLSPQLEGEALQVEVEGFFGGDRTDLELPKVQKELIRDIKALGKPVVLVLFNGSALAVNWENENLPAIVEAWYPGQEGGTALADILFGDYNPSGCLPVTFYKSVDDLPPFEDYSMKGRTYRYFEGEPLYRFGYGLSYSEFTCDTLSNGSVKVTNNGPYDGSKVIQWYLDEGELCRFERVTLKAGETKIIR